MAAGADNRSEPRASVEQEEHVLGRWPSRCKKVNGELLFTTSRLVPSRLVHKPEGADQAMECVCSVDLREVKTYQFSRQKTPADKACLQLVTGSGAKIIIELTSPNQRWVHLKEVAECIKIREEEQNRFEEVQERDAQIAGLQMRVVLGCPELREQYQYLVQQADIMTLTEFLEAYTQDIATRMPLPTAAAVDLTTLSVGLAQQQQGSGKVENAPQLSEEEVQSVFREFPALEKLYQTQVPLPLSPAHFWKRCLSSRYYLEALGKDVSQGHPFDSMFDTLERPPPRTAIPSASVVTTTTDATMDLTCEVFRPPEAHPKQEKSLLVSRLNERSAGVLAAMQAAQKGSVTEPPAAVDRAATEDATSCAVTELLRTVARRREGLKREVTEGTKEALTNDGPPPKAPRLQVRGDRLKAALGTSVVASTASGSSRSGGSSRQLRAVAGADAQSERLRQWLCRPMALPTAPSEAGAKSVLREATDEMITAEKLGRVGRRSAEAESGGDSASEAARAQLLLRRFWASRRSEVSVRLRLATEMKGLESKLASWLRATSQIRPGTSQPPEGRVARSFLPPLQQACAVYESMRFNKEAASAAGDAAVAGCHRSRCNA